MAPHIMLDLETMSSKPTALILSIGAVAFDIKSGTIMETFYERIAWQTTINKQFDIEPSTVAWWLCQSQEARMDIMLAGEPLAPVLEAFRSFVLGYGAPLIWGNGAAFDNVVLRHAYEALNIGAPWTFRQDACYRSLKTCFPTKQDTMKGVQHNALDDATAQAKHLMQIVRTHNLKALLEA